MTARSRLAIAAFAGAGGLVGLVGLGACGDDPVVLAPVIDVPTNDLDATAAPLDDIAITIAHAGSDRDLVTQTFLHGESIDLPGVPFADDLVLHMTGFVSKSSVAYGRTCSFAVSPSGGSAAPHLFFSRSVKFANLDISPVTRLSGLGVSYLGAVVLLGGVDVAGVAVSEVERYDPVTNRLSQIGTLEDHPQGAQAVVGNPPRIVVMGGKSDRVGPKLVEVIDGQTVDHTEFADLARADLTATALADGRVIAIGGQPAIPGAPPSTEIDEIAPADAAIGVRRLAVSLAHGRSGHTATRISDDVGAPVLIAGGLGDTGAPLAVAELFKPLSESLVSLVPTLVVPRHHHVAARMPNGSVLIIGGLDAAMQPVRMLELFSLDAGFVPIGDLPADAGVIDFATTTLPDGRILITGGRTAPGGQPSNTAYIIRLDPLNGRIDVVATDHMALLRANHQTAVLCDGTVLISGGTQVALPAERYNPPPAGRR